MFWYVALGVVATLLALSLVIPTTQRVWSFHLRFLWHFPLRWLGCKLGLCRWSGPEAARLFCEDMGPTFIKFGQIIASSAGMFPERYSHEFEKCLDQVRPFSFEQVRAIIERELGADKAARLRDIDPVPLASASIAQVHTATLDDGTAVVVKVQRPGIQGRVAEDMRIMRWAATVAEKVLRDAELANPVGVIDDFAATLREELDFRMEAKNLDQFNGILRELGHSHVRAPQPHWDFTTARVLVMERFFGVRVDQIPGVTRQIDGEERLILGMRAWFQSVLFYGFFHGDVHAGNLMLLDNDDIGFLDFGIVGRFDDLQREMVTDYLIAFSTGDYTKLAQVIALMGGVGNGIDLAAFAADLKDTYSPLLTLKMSEINYADFIPKIQRVATRHRMKLPKEFVLITKQMLYFDRYAKLLAPTLNVFTDPRLLVSLMTDIKKAKDMQRARSASDRSKLNQSA